MSNQQNIALVKKLYDELYTKGNIAAAEQLFATDVKLIDSSAPNFRGGLTGLKERETMFKKAFPDKNSKIDDIFSTEDRVVVRWTTTGTHKGSLQNIAPTGKSVKVSGISVYRIVNGKITEISQAWDRLGLLEQIGVVEPATALHR